MDKVLVIVPDNNKGKYIAKGYSSAFKDFSYFVFERKIYDLNVKDIEKMSPNVIFCFWSEMKNNDILLDFYNSFSNDETVFINCAEKLSDIPKELYTKSYCFTADNKLKKHKINLGINSKDYKTKFRGFNYAITFAGNPAYPNREKLLAHLIYNFGNINIFCRSYDFYKSVDEISNAGLLTDEYLELYRNSYKGYVENQKELSKIFISSKINIDMDNPNKKNINYRVYEILSSGGFLLAPKSKEISNGFDEGKEFDSYIDEIDLVDKINFYLKNVNIAQSMALKGRRNTASNHSFYDRLKKILKVIYGKDFSNR